MLSVVNNKNKNETKIIIITFWTVIGLKEYVIKVKLLNIVYYVYIYYVYMYIYNIC